MTINPMMTPTTIMAGAIKSAVTEIGMTSVTHATIGGTNSDDVVGTMSWTNALTGAAGTLSAASPWTIPDIDLAVGANDITVVGTNELGVVGEDLF